MEENEDEKKLGMGFFLRFLEYEKIIQKSYIVKDDAR